MDSGTLDVAVRDAYAAAKPGDTVLLAPACASFDQFDSYEHRGQVFKELVAQLEPKELMAQRLKTDWILFITVVVMVFFGLLMLYSASSMMAQLKYGSSWHFVMRQLAWAVVAMVVMMALKRTHYRTAAESGGGVFGAVGVALILLLAVYFVDRRITAGCAWGPSACSPRSWPSRRW